jgi:hypothetical protein
MDCGTAGGATEWVKGNVWVQGGSWGQQGRTAKVEGGGMGGLAFSHQS